MAKTLNNTVENRMEQCADRIVEIAAVNMPRLEREIDKLNRRADKIGCPHIRYDILATEKRPDPNVVRQLISKFGNPVPQRELDKTPHLEMHTIHIMGEGPKVDGWKFVGTLDHYSLPGKVIINTVPGEKVPEQYFDHEANCDHCNKIRRRVETFVLEGTDENEGQWKLVGRNCLRDFFGHDPMYIARFLNRIWTFIDGLSKDDRWGDGGFGRIVHYYDSMEVLTTTVACIRTFGWLSRSAAGYDRTPTSAHVSHAINRPWSGGDTHTYDAWKAFVASIQFDETKDLEEAKAALEWLKEKDAGNSEYLYNLKQLEDEKHIPAKMIGYWCSMIAVYQREQDKLKRTKLQKKLNEYYGTVGDRVELRVKCTGVTTTEGYYGILNIHRMLTEEGHSLIWFANAGRKMEEDNEYIIRARIKDHNEYKNWKQTNLSRLFVVEKIEGDVK